MRLIAFGFGFLKLGNRLAELVIRNIFLLNDGFLGLPDLFQLCFQQSKFFPPRLKKLRVFRFLSGTGRFRLSDCLLLLRE